MNTRPGALHEHIRPLLAPEQVRAFLGAGLVTGLFTTAIISGWRNLPSFDAALVCYGAATLFACFATLQRLLVWAQRPPTWMYFRRGLPLLLYPRHLAHVVVAGASYFLLNRFIRRRGWMRWGAHWPIMAGCVLAGAIAFPLVFGWLHFVTVDDDLERYRIIAFGRPLLTFAVGSLFAFALFHGLVWSSFLVLIGVAVALVRRLRDRGDQAVQEFTEDLLPLVLLFAVSVTGLMLTVSYTWLRGHAYDFLAIVHAITVVFGLLWVPFGKLFHVAQRTVKPAQLAYAHAAARGPQAACRRCGSAFAAQVWITDLITVERALGYRYELPDGGHYQEVCPRCRRALLVLAQGARWRGQPAPADLPTVSSSATGTP